MQGQVFVPYTGIGGFNLNPGISTFAMGGSTNPGVVEDEYGTTVNVTWMYPGGIQNKNYNGEGLWGYVLVPSTVDPTYVVDSMVKQWLMMDYDHKEQVEVQPTKKYTEEEIASEFPTIQSDINLLVSAYIHRLLLHGGLMGGSFDKFQQNFGGCYTVGSVKKG